MPQDTAAATPADPEPDVIYKGSHRGSSGPGPVWLERPDGELIGALRHVVHHSPSGLSWGYGGSGPADLARSILIDACPDEMTCPSCKGTRRVVFVGAEDVEPRPAPDDADPDEVVRCMDCSDGYRWDRYQDFKWEVIAGLPDEFTLSRAEVRAWFRANTDTESR
jgi:hypothetical protein